VLGLLLSLVDRGFVMTAQMKEKNKQENLKFYNKNIFNRYDVC
jgi:hypothetical protein